jgi:hypothetical protein
MHLCGDRQENGFFSSATLAGVGKKILLLGSFLAKHQPWNLCRPAVGNKRFITMHGLRRLCSDVLLHPCSVPARTRME